MRIHNTRTVFAICRRAFANSSSWICIFVTPRFADVALLVYALSLIYQDGFAEIRLKAYGLMNANSFSRIREFWFRRIAFMDFHGFAFVYSFGFATDSQRESIDSQTYKKIQPRMTSSAQKKEFSRK